MKSFTTFVLLVLISHLSIAQISQGGVPYSFSNKMESLNTVKVNIDKQDIEENEVNKDCKAMVFAHFLPVNISLRDKRWQTQKTADGTMVYRLALSSENAKAVGAYFSQLFIPRGAQLFVYSPDHQQLIGAFTSFNNKPSALLPTEYIIGDQLIIEYMEPSDVAGEGYFVVDELLHAYRGINTFNDKSGFGSAGACEVNVNCSEGNGKGKQRDAVLRILVKTGSMGIWCSATLINNTSEDQTPYVLTADHCGKNSSEAEHHQWVFYFNYQADGCVNPNVEPVHRTMVSCVEIAASSNTKQLGSDFYLVRLENDIPDSYHPYFVGWNRTGQGSTEGYTIHHPRGDIKKISHYTQPLEDGEFQNGMENGFWEVHWSETESGYGVTEGGSSGSPIFDKYGYLIGTLTGGRASCDSLALPDYYGKFSMHWASNGTEMDEQLSFWLDPINTGQMYLDGLYLGMEEENALSDGLFQAAPNPVTNLLHIHLDQNHQDYQLEIFDISGRSIQNLHHTGNTDLDIPFAGFKKGVYLLKISNSSQMQLAKIIKN